MTEAEDLVAARGLAESLGAGEARRAQERIGDLIRHTPLLSSRSLSEALGARVLLKAENLQRTGSFKLRGALNRLRTLEHPQAVVAASAGNHGQSLAYAARASGVRCEVFMPRLAPVGKIAAVEAFGGRVTFIEGTVDECLPAAQERASAAGIQFVHPFDDPEVVLGQGTLGLELLRDVADLGAVVVPVGGGGLIAGVAGTIKASRPAVRVIGVQVQSCAPFAAALRTGAEAGIEVSVEVGATPAGSATIADGIAIKRPGRLTLPLVERFVDDWITVTEDEVADAMVWLMERSKLVVEGGGAVGVAAILAGRLDPAPSGATVVVLSGGNVDPGLLAAIVGRHESSAGRRLRLFTRISDRPGGLAALLALIAREGGNVVRAEHVREEASLHVLQTGVEVVLETRGADHGAAIVAAVRDAGYAVTPRDSR